MVQRGAVIDAFTSWQRTGIEDDPHHQVFLCTLVRCNYTETFQGPPYTLCAPIALWSKNIF